MKILITGSSGQIGTNLTLKLIEQGHEVFGIDKRVNTWTKDFECLLLDLSQKFSRFDNGFGEVKLPFKPDIVVHLAANAKVYELVKDPTMAIDNITMTNNVLEFCRINKIPIIYASSREVYGNIKRSEAERPKETHEKMVDFAFTESPYSASKISGEAMIYSYSKCYNLPYIILRFSNVYGRYDNDIGRMERVIPLFIHKIDAREKIVVFGKNKILDFTYIDDCIQGIILAIKKFFSGEVKNETINLAYGKGHSLIDLVSYIEESLNKKAKMKIEKAKVGEVTYYIADISKARKLLGYNPQTTLKEGITKTINWYKHGK